MRQLQVNLKNKLTSNYNIGKVLQILQKVFAKNTNACNEVINFIRRYNAWKAKERNGTMLSEQKNTEINTLVINMMSLIDEITSEEEVAYALEDAIFHKILIISKTTERKTAMQKLFSDNYYKEVTFLVVPKSNLAAETLLPYQIILFDDMIEKDDTYFQQYQYYLDNAAPYILYFGQGRKVSSGDPQNPKAYFANSIFSLHARLNEMLTYLKYKVN